MSVLESAIGWLAPPQCIGCGQEGSTICFACSTSEILPYGERCWNCGALSLRCRTCERCRRLGSPRFLWITTDYEGIAKELIHTYKFDHQRVAAKSIARLMADTFLSFNSDKDIVKLNYLVVPIPTASSRVRQRGFDHSVLLAQKMADRLQIPSRSVLRRVGQSRQLGAPRQIRLRQLDGSYQVHDPKLLERRNVLLVDDVLTTGGTLCAASRALRHVGASRVDALVFAKRL